MIHQHVGTGGSSDKDAALISIGGGGGGHPEDRPNLGRKHLPYEIIYHPLNTVLEY